MFCKLILATALLVMAVASPVEKRLPERSRRTKRISEDIIPGKEKAVWNTPSQTSAPRPRRERNESNTKPSLIDLWNQQHREGHPVEDESLWRQYIAKNNVGAIDKKEYIRVFWKHKTLEELKEKQAVQHTLSQTSAPNNRLSMQDYIDKLKSRYPLGDPSDFGSLIWKRYYDKNNNGSMDKDDFIRAQVKYHRMNVEETLKTNFYIYDRNDDGHLTKDELREVDDMIKKCRPPPRAYTRPSAMLKLFDSIDTGHDGQMTLEELLAARDTYQRQ